MQLEGWGVPEGWGPPISPACICPCQAACARWPRLSICPCAMTSNHSTDQGRCLVRVQATTSLAARRTGRASRQPSARSVAGGRPWRRRATSAPPAWRLPWTAPSAASCRRPRGRSFRLQGPGPGCGPEWCHARCCLFALGRVVWPVAGGERRGGGSPCPCMGSPCSMVGAPAPLGAVLPHSSSARKDVQDRHSISRIAIFQLSSCVHLMQHGYRGLGWRWRWTQE